MLDITICIIANAFRIYLIRRLNIIFLCKDKNKEVEKREIIAYGSFYVINTVLYLGFHVAGINIVCNLVGISMLTRLYTKEFKMTLFVTGAIYIVSMVCDLIPVRLFVEYQDGKSFAQIYQILIDFLFFVCVLLIEKIVQYRTGNNMVHSWLLIFVPICSIAMVWYLGRTNIKQNQQRVVVAIGILIINFFVFYLYNMLHKVFSKLYEADMLKEKIQAYSNQMNVLLESGERVKTLRHDMKHHMNELKILAMNNDSTGVQEYINEMEEYVQNPSEIVSTGNMEIDSLLNFMLQRAERELTSVNVKVKISEDFSYSFDINTVIGNLLENAIEAARQSEEKMLTGLIQVKQGILKIELENSFSGELNQDDGKFSTTKKRKDIHGIGLKSVRKIVEKYNGVLEIESKDNRFCVRTIVYIN